MEFIGVLLFAIVLLYVFFRLKNTVFGISLNKGNYLGFFVFYDLIIYIIPSVLLLNYFPIDNFWVAFKVKQNTIFYISILIIFLMCLYFFMLKRLAIINNKYFILKSYIPLQSYQEKKIKVFLFLSIIVCIVMILLFWTLLGIGHSFSLSFLNDVSISELRFDIKERKETKFAKHLFIFITPFFTAILGSGIYKKPIVKWVLLIGVLFIASWGGSKGPLLTVFIVYFASYATFNKVKINFKLVLKVIFLIIILLFLVYRVVLFQYSEMTEIGLFFNYFSQRVFVAQMIGVYEQFNLLIQDSMYIWHGVPFASSFMEFPVFHKDLMLISEDRVDASAIGIKNTLFIAEAYAMGGLYLLVFSPFWMAFVYSVNYRWMTFVTNKYIFNNLEYTKRIVALSIFSYVSVSGGFSDLMFFKITILMTLLLLPFITLKKFINFKKR